MKKFELIAGRHQTPASKAIFVEVSNATDVETMEREAARFLLQEFPAYERRSFCPSAAISAEDVTVAYRGEMTLYVTGLSVALVAVLNAARRLGVDVTLMHYDRVSGEYYPQKIAG